MHQVLFEVPGLGLTIHGFGVMLLVAFLASIWLASRRARAAGLDPILIQDLAFWMIIGGLVGARAFYVIQHNENIDSFWDVFKIWEGGIVLYGSLIGAAAGFGLYWSRHRFPIRAMLDVIAPAVALGMAIGRIGCFLNGCCYGDVCDPSRIPWAVEFPSGTLPWADHVHEGRLGTDAPRSLPVHPTQLYAAIDGFLLAWLLIAFTPLKRRDGEVIALLFVAYPISRFLIERLRDDEAAVFAGMTISQNISLLVVALGIGLWLWLPRRSGSAAEARAAGAESSG